MSNVGQTKSKDSILQRYLEWLRTQRELGYLKNILFDDATSSLLENLSTLDQNTLLAIDHTCILRELSENKSDAVCSVQRVPYTLQLIAGEQYGNFESMAFLVIYEYKKNNVAIEQHDTLTSAFKKWNMPLCKYISFEAIVPVLRYEVLKSQLCFETIGIILRFDCFNEQSVCIRKIDLLFNHTNWNSNADFIHFSNLLLKRKILPEHQVILDLEQNLKLCQKIRFGKFFKKPHLKTLTVTLEERYRKGMRLTKSRQHKDVSDPNEFAPWNLFSCYEIPLYYPNYTGNIATFFTRLEVRASRYLETHPQLLMSTEKQIGDSNVNNQILLSDTTTGSINIENSNTLDDKSQQQSMQLENDKNDTMSQSLIVEELDVEKMKNSLCNDTSSSRIQNDNETSTQDVQAIMPKTDIGESKLISTHNLIKNPIFANNNQNIHAEILLAHHITHIEQKSIRSKSELEIPTENLIESNQGAIIEASMQEREQTTKNELIAKKEKKVEKRERKHKNAKTEKESIKKSKISPETIGISTDSIDIESKPKKKIKKPKLKDTGDTDNHTSINKITLTKDLVLVEELFVDIANCRSVFSDQRKLAIPLTDGCMQYCNSISKSGNPSSNAIETEFITVHNNKSSSSNSQSSVIEYDFLNSSNTTNMMYENFPSCYDSDAFPYSETPMAHQESLQYLSPVKVQKQFRTETFPQLHCLPPKPQMMNIHNIKVEALSPLETPGLNDDEELITPYVIFELQLIYSGRDILQDANNYWAEAKEHMNLNRINPDSLYIVPNLLELVMSHQSYREFFLIHGQRTVVETLFCNLKKYVLLLPLKLDETFARLNGINDSYTKYHLTRFTDVNFDAHDWIKCHKYWNIEPSKCLNFSEKFVAFENLYVPFQKYSPYQLVSLDHWFRLPRYLVDNYKKTATVTELMCSIRCGVKLYNETSLIKTINCETNAKLQNEIYLSPNELHGYMQQAVFETIHEIDELPSAESIFIRRNIAAVKVYTLTENMVSFHFVFNFAVSSYMLIEQLEQMFTNTVQLRLEKRILKDLQLIKSQSIPIDYLTHTGNKEKSVSVNIAILNAFQTGDDLKKLINQIQLDAIRKSKTSNTANAVNSVLYSEKCVFSTDIPNSIIYVLPIFLLKQQPMPKKQLVSIETTMRTETNFYPTLAVSSQKNVEAATFAIFELIKSFPEYNIFMQDEEKLELLAQESLEFKISLRKIAERIVIIYDPKQHRKYLDTYFDDESTVTDAYLCQITNLLQLQTKRALLELSKFRYIPVPLRLMLLDMTTAFYHAIWSAGQTN